MENTKMTKVMAINYVLENCEIPTEVAEKLQTMAEQIAKKNATRSTKPSAKTVENNAIREAILSVMTTEPMTQAEIKALCPEVAEKSPQAFGQLMMPMVKNGTVIKTIVKKIPMYALAE